MHPVYVASQPSFAQAMFPAAGEDVRFAQASTARFDGLAFPAALLRPLEVLFAPTPVARENFLAGLRGERLLGARILTAEGPRSLPLAWVGMGLLAGAGSVFRELRGGCWVRGFPAVGRGRELLQAGGMGDAAALAAVLRCLGAPSVVGPVLYFNFHYDEPAAGCERVYLLDAQELCLHALALPPGAAGRRLRACA